MDAADARRLLAGVDAFTRDRGDELWRALLALATADEFVDIASRLRWEFHPRGFDNTELHQRFGDGIVPWLATRLDDRGVLHNTPWCVVPCLLACGSLEAFALAWRTTTIEGRTPWGGAGPDGDLVLAWSARHPGVALVALERLAPTSARARAYLRAVRPPAGPPSVDDVLALIDACAAGLVGTRVRLAPGPAHDVRAVVARAGEDWGIALEWVAGTRPSGLFAASAAGVAFGSRVRGAIDGATATSRPLADVHGATLDARLGPPGLAVPALALGEGATIVAVVPHLAHAPVPGEAPAWRALAAAAIGPR